MVIPGVSGSLLLMMFGYYYSLIETAKELLENLRALQFSVSLPLAFILLPFFLGLALGGYVLSSCVTWFFTEHRFSTYCAVLGIIVSSLFTIFHHMGIFALLPTLSIQESLCGILLFVGGMLLTNQLSQTGTA